MDDQISDRARDDRRLAFTRALLDDVRALERMIDEGLIESGVRRIGAEQEVFLVDRSTLPALSALEILRRVDHPQITTELGLFNLEINLSPLALTGDCLRQLHQEIDRLLSRLRRAAEPLGSRILLTGILPTMRQDDLTLDAMTPYPRYRELNRASIENRGSEFRVHIKGLDELVVMHDNVMFEACNTAFQVHFQVGPEEFAELYNLAQAISGPLLAASVNSPVFLQHRLWAETRMALFRQSVDTRPDVHRARKAPTRVVFGDRWIEKSVLEIFREDIARFRVFITTRLDESPMEQLDRGEVPLLRALCMHNGTVYRWNRPCYGVLDGRPHLRIEHRILPSGPTVIDEVSNAAFFHGMMTALSGEYGDVTRVMEFDDAKTNFMAAARYGLKAGFQWIRDESFSADALILDHLLPLARQGLREKKVDSSDIDHYLGIVEERVRSGKTGAQWVLDSLAGLGNVQRPMERFRRITACMYDRHLEGEPVHRWGLACGEDGLDWDERCRTVEHLMTVDLFTVLPDDLIELATSLMDWRHIRHVPVEDQNGRLVGLISHRQLLRLFGRELNSGRETVAVRDVMIPDPVSVSPRTAIVEAIEIMRRNGVSCLPVVDSRRKLVGIVTERDFIDVAAHLLQAAEAPDEG